MLDVSVALCTHNGASYVEKQLQSIFAQTMLPKQIVISDDASSDDTVAVIESVVHRLTLASRSDPIEITIVRNPVALGVAKNFEQAMRLCRGDLIALCDQDDIWRVDRVEYAVVRFEADTGLDLVHSDARLVDESDASLGLTLFEALEISDAERKAIEDGNGFDTLLRRNLATGATMMVKRALYQRAMPFPSVWVHDEWLAVIGAATGHIDLTTELLIDYRQHGRNQIGVRKLGMVGKVRRILEPRGERNVYLAERAKILLQRLEELGAAVPGDRLEQVRQKVDHQNVRAGLPDARIARVVPVLREAATGRYSRFSRGSGDVLRDLLQVA